MQEKKLKNMLIERDQEHENDIINLKRRLNTEVKVQSKSQDRVGGVAMGVPGGEIVGFESNCSFIY